MVTPKLRQRAPMPLATPTPATRPSADATTPTTAASIATLRRTCLVLAPIARSRASSLVRCATRIAKVLLMMKAPTSRATAAKTRMKMPKKSTSSFFRLLFSFSSAVPVTTSRSPPSARADAAGELGLADAGRGVHRDAVDRAVPAEQPLGRVEREQHGAVAGPVVGVAEARHADHGHVGRSGHGQHRRPVARREVGLVGRASGRRRPRRRRAARGRSRGGTG